MKSRRRYSSSESEDSAASVESDSEPSSESEASESVSSEHARREKKHKRRAPSSGSGSDEGTRRRAKKRKHKKKKKKHGKKRRRDQSASIEEEASESDAEEREQQAVAHKHKHSHKYKMSRSRSPNVPEVHVHSEHKSERSRSGGVGARLQSVVKDRRRTASPRRDSPPSPEPHRYYDRPKEREYERSASEEYEPRREVEVERFYRGSSKDRSQRSAQPRYQQENRYVEHDRYDRYGGGGGDGGGAPGYNNGGGQEHYSRSHRTRDYGEPNIRQSKYEERREEEEYPRERESRDEHYRPHRDREYAPRNETYHEHDDRGDRAARHFGDKFGPVCLVCDEAHVGRACRRRPERFRQSEKERPDRERGREREFPRDERRHDTKRVAVKTEREDRPREREEREERRRSSRERRERPRPSSPRKEPPRESPKPREQARERASKTDAREVKRERRESPPARRERSTRFDAAEGNSFSWGKQDEEVKKEPAADKDKPNFALSGKLAAETNMVNGILLKYSEPDDAKQPKRRWRFYPFKGDKALPILYIHRQSCFILGRDHKAVDIPLEHPSVSKQHAALQYRATPYTRPDGTQARRVRPYIIDLDSANGTFVNNKKIETRRFVELLERDVVKFGFSQREYVLLHENSKDDGDDDNQEMGGGAAEASGAAAAPEVGEAVVCIAAVKREKQIKLEQKEDGE